VQIFIAQAAVATTVKPVLPTGLSIDLRIIAATNQDVHRAISASQFRKDLYYRPMFLRWKCRCSDSV